MDSTSMDLSSGSLIVLDDIFPQVLSAFRYEEFRSYLDEWPHARVYTTGLAFSFAKETRPVSAVIAEYEAKYPRHAGRVLEYDFENFPVASLYYCIFINNISIYVDKIESVGAKFVFTLYPGGGLQLDHPDCEAKLHRVFSSPAFAKVIVTQPITQRYLLGKDLCHADQIVPIFGGVLPRDAFDPPPKKLRFGRDKEVADICFVANLYMPKGYDKGYDLFVEAAQALIKSGQPVRFHVVGPYDPSVIPLEDAEPYFQFYGMQPTAFFRNFYSKMDAILSPNRPFVLGEGSFDGFPVGCCIEAGLQAVAVLCTDELELNVSYRDGIDICLVRPDLDDIVRKMERLLKDPDLLRGIGENGRIRMLDVYGPHNQIKPRIDLLNSVAGNGWLSEA